MNRQSADFEDKGIKLLLEKKQVSDSVRKANNPYNYIEEEFNLDNVSCKFIFMW